MANNIDLEKVFTRVEYNRMETRNNLDAVDAPFLKGMVIVRANRVPIAYKEADQDRFLITEHAAGILYSWDNIIFNRFAEFFNQEELPDRYGASRVTRRIPGYEITGIWLNSILSCNRAFMFELGSVAALVPVFAKLPLFPYRYQDYLANPDQGVDIFRAAHFEQSYGIYETMCGLGRNHANGEQLPAAIKSKGQHHFLVHIITISLFKNFTGQDHVRMFVERRIAAFCAATANYDVSIENWQNIINPLCIPNIARTFAAFPKLRAALINCVTAVGDDTYSHTKMLLSNVGLASSVMIGQFLQSDQKTAMHIEPQILREALIYVDTWHQVLEVWGEDMKYLRILSPGNTAFDLNKWPNLAYVSYVALSNRLGAPLAQYNFSTTGVTVKGVPRKLATPLNDGVLNQAHGVQQVHQLLAQFGDRLTQYLGFSANMAEPGALQAFEDMAPNQEELNLYMQVTQNLAARARGIVPNPPNQRV